MLVRNLISDQIEIPGEPGQWMRFRRLNSRRISECTEKRQIDALNRMKSLGADGLAIIRDAAAAATSKTVEEETAVATNPVDSYDRDLLLKYGIAEWSYPVDPKFELGSEDGGLDAVTSDWAATEILRFNGLLPKQQDEELGN